MGACFLALNILTGEFFLHWRILVYFLDRTALAVNSLYRLIARERNVCGKMWGIEGEGGIRLSRGSSLVSCGVCGKNLAVSES